MKQKQIVAFLLIGVLSASIFSACGNEKESVPVPAVQEVSESTDSAASTQLEETSLEETSSAKSVSDKEPDAEYGDKEKVPESVSTSKETEPETPSESKEEAPGVELNNTNSILPEKVQEVIDNIQIDEDGNVVVQKTDDNNVLPEDVDPSEYVVDNTESYQEREGVSDASIDFDAMQTVFSEIAGFAQGDAGSTMKVTSIVNDAMELANTINASALGKSILSPAIASVFSQMMGFEKENIADNLQYIYMVGNSMMNGDEATKGAFEDAGELSRAESILSNESTHQNWDALWESVVEALKD